MSRILLLAALAFGASSTAAAQDATVYIGHGINGTDLVLDENLPVDVKVNGAVLLSGFEFRTFTEALSLAAGPYNIQIGVADPINPGSQPALIDVNVDLVASENVTILAHLDEFGGLTASKFINETDPVDGLNGRLSAAHTAAAPAVDVRLKELQSRRAGQLAGVTNGLQGAGVFRPVVFGLDLVAAGTTTQVLGPVYLPVLPGSRTAIYVVGSLANDTLEPLVLNY